MILDNKDSVYATCEKLGEAAVRSKIDAGDFGGHSAFPRQWLLEKADEHIRQNEQEVAERNKRAVAAAEQSAAAAERAALAARDSARWTMWAAIVALVSILAQYFKKWVFVKECG